MRTIMGTMYCHMTAGQAPSYSVVMATMAKRCIAVQAGCGALGAAGILVTSCSGMLAPHFAIDRLKTSFFVSSHFCVSQRVSAQSYVVMSLR